MNPWELSNKDAKFGDDDWGKYRYQVVQDPTTGKWKYTGGRKGEYGDYEINDLAAKALESYIEVSILENFIFPPTSFVVKL